MTFAPSQTSTYSQQRRHVERSHGIMFFITEKNGPPTILPPSATHARLLDLKRHLRGLLRLCGALTQHGLDDLLLLDQERADDAVETTK